ncbi:UNVERIFIED_CONTAM: hypothetical protein GTU68_058129 [Idotea baltica]|nr:hypothetical protein [Idotea baltica]
MRAVPIAINNIDRATSLFDAYRVFYHQESNLSGCKEFLASLLEGKKNHLWIAENEKGDEMGFVNLYPSFTSVGMAPVFILNDLYVNPNYRKSGVGTFLLTHAADWAKTRGAIRLHLETGTDNHIAQKLYEGIGWKKEKDTYFYYLPL